MEDSYDVVVIGGGPAGLAAALWLARYRLRVRLFDSADPRNRWTGAVHGYLGLEEVDPAELRRVGREQAIHAGAEIEAACVEEVRGELDDFEVVVGEGRSVRCRRVLFATGLRDIRPEIPGLDDFYGHGIWHCADCDGPSVSGKRIGVIGWGRQIAALCMQMLTWTDRITLFTHGRDAELPARSREALDRFEIRVVTEPIERIEGDERPERIVLQGGGIEEIEAAFFHIACGPGSSMPAGLGCEADEEGILQVDRDYETTVPGVYAAGDITRGSRLAIHAAAGGTRAAIGIYRSLLPEERRV